MTGRRWMFGALVLAASLIGGCKKDREKAAPAGGLGVAVETGRAEDLRRSPDGAHVAYLIDGVKPGIEGLAPKAQLGALHVAPVAGGKGRLVARGVTNLPGGFIFSDDSRWIFALADYEIAGRVGKGIALSLEGPDTQRVELGARVSNITASPDSSQVAFVDGGVLKLGPLPSGPFREIGGEILHATFTPDGQHLFFKRRLIGGGGLMVVEVKEGATPRRLADQVGDFRISPDGKRVAFAARSPESRDIYDLHVADLPALAPRQVAVGVTDFRFSPDGSRLARLEGFALGVEPELYVGPASGEGGRRLGNAVGTYTFSPDSRKLAFLDSFSSSASAGVLRVVELPEGEPRRLGVRVPNFDWAADSSAIAFIQRVFEPVYSIDLMVYRLGEEAPRQLGSAVYGYGFGPDSQSVFYRTGCQREGRSCNLMRASVETAESERIASGIYTYEVSKDAERVLITQWPIGLRSQKVSIVGTDGKGLRLLDEETQLPAFLVDGDARVAYARSGEQQGVYVAPAELDATAGATASP